ncbi:MAG TPA: alpha/beta hydrolase [Acidobacteriaceae bacterium]|jgi:pimeloyl-ACP methyl ester carboxylesterase|nr:alpha/beta hydrolase [Acidobacteriaceae bacterium]
MIVGAAFSPDWDLVQPQVAKFTRVCTFDPSGTAWSDSFQAAIRVLDPNSTLKQESKQASRQAPTCEDRVDEIHRLITKAAIPGPYILVGYSVGALWERLYAAEHPENIAGMVIVDHAFLPRPKAPDTTPSAERTAPRHGYTPPVLISKVPLVLGFEDDVNFSRLPQRDQDAHMWAMAQHPIRPGEQMTENCLSRISRISGADPYPLGPIPLTVISTPNDTPGYAELQISLLALSHRSRHVIASHSSHMVPIDEPDVIVAAINSAVETARSKQ